MSAVGLGVFKSDRIFHILNLLNSYAFIRGAFIRGITRVNPLNMPMF